MNNPTVKVSYNLTDEARKLAAMSGNVIPSGTVTVIFETSKDELKPIAGRINLAQDGTLSIPLTSYLYRPIQISAIPETLKEALHLYDEQVNAIKTKDETEKNAQKLREEEAAKKLAEQAVIDAPVAEKVVADLENLPITSQWPSEVSTYDGSILFDHRNLIISPEIRERVLNAAKNRAQALAKIEADKKAAKELAIAKEVETYGGFRFILEAGMTGFTGRNLWAGSQTKRWVGTFTAARGIEYFLPSPKGEFIFDVSRLTKGDCVQFGGYDTKGNGKRRNESEAFGVVVSSDSEAIVILECESRAEAKKEAQKLLKIEKQAVKN